MNQPKFQLHRITSYIEAKPSLARSFCGYVPFGKDYDHPVHKKAASWAAARQARCRRAFLQTHTASTNVQGHGLGRRPAMLVFDAVIDLPPSAPHKLTLRTPTSSQPTSAQLANLAGAALAQGGCVCRCGRGAGGEPAPCRRHSSFNISTQIIGGASFTSFP